MVENVPTNEAFDTYVRLMSLRQDDIEKIIGDKNYVDIKKDFDFSNLLALNNTIKFIDGNEVHLKDLVRLLYSLHISYRMTEILSLLSFKENLLKKYINAGDIQNHCGIEDSIEIYRLNPSNLGISQLLAEIRNGFMHNGYMITNKGIIVYNPSVNGRSTELFAHIKGDFFEALYETIGMYNRRVSFVFGKDIDYSKGYEWNKDKIFKAYTDKSSMSYYSHIDIQNIINSDFNIDNLGRYNISGKCVSDVIGGTDYKQDLLRHYFDKHDFNYRNLYNCVYCTEDVYSSDIDRQMMWIIEEIVVGISNNINENLNDFKGALFENFDDVVAKFSNSIGSLNTKYNKDEILENLMRNEIDSIIKSLDGYDWQKDGSSMTSDDKELFKNLITDVSKGKYKDWIISDLNKSFIFGKKVSRFFDFDIVSLLLGLHKSLIERYEIKSFLLELLPNYLKVLYLTKRYTTNPSINGHTSGEIISEDEHIRNAFAHHQFSILPGVNEIVLWDYSQKRGEKDWSKIYDLNGLYNKCRDDIVDFLL